MKWQKMTLNDWEQPEKEGAVEISPQLLLIHRLSRRLHSTSRLSLPPVLLFRVLPAGNSASGSGFFYRIYLALSHRHYLYSPFFTLNKPDWATMRPGCVSVCIEHVTYLNRQMDKQTDETTRVVKESLKSWLSIIWLSIGFHRGQKQLKNADFALA